MNPPDREGRGQSVVEPLGHPFKYDGHGLPDACSFPGCSLPRSAHTGGEAEHPGIICPTCGQTRIPCYAPQPAPQGGGGEQGLIERATVAAGIGIERVVGDGMVQTSTDAWRCTGCFVDTGDGEHNGDWPPDPFPHDADCPSLVIPQLVAALASRDSQLAEKDARIADLQKRGDDAIKLKAVLHAQWLRRFNAAETMLAAQAAEIERLKGERVEEDAVLEWVLAAVRGEPVSDFGESLQPVRDALDLRAERDNLARREIARASCCTDNEARAERAEQERDALRAREKRCTDLLDIYGAPSDTAGRGPGYRLAHLVDDLKEQLSALRALYVELLDRLQHEDDCQFQYGPPRLECDCGLDAVIARAKALQP